VEISGGPAKLTNGDTLDETPVGGGFGLQSLISIPATTAILLGLIYAVGAVTRSAELNHAGVPLSVAFPLIPIEQDLARGVQVIVAPSLLRGAIFVVVGIALFIMADDLKKHRDTINQRKAVEAAGAGQALTGTATTPGQQQKGIVKRYASISFGSALLLYAAVDTPLIFASAIIGGLVGFAIFRATPTPRRLTPALWVMLMAFMLAVSSLVIELVAPPSLPTVKLQRTLGGPVSGPLIASANATWYVGAPGGGVLAVESRYVLTATIKSGHASKLANESLIGLVGL
jgi:hypothetical protein